MLSSTSATYDAAGRVVQSIGTSWMITNNEYDAVGNLIETREVVNGVTRTMTSTYSSFAATKLFFGRELRLAA